MTLYGVKNTMFTEYMRKVEVFREKECGETPAFSYRYTVKVSEQSGEEGTITVNGTITSLEVAMVDSTAVDVKLTCSFDVEDHKFYEAE